MTKEIHDINARALDFVVELIEYIFEYPDDDYMTMECLCRKLHKYGLVDKKDGLYLVADDTLRKTESDSEKPNNCEDLQDWKDRMWAEAIVTEPTISKMEQVDEPITQTKTQNSNLTFEKADERCKGCNHYKLTCDLFSEICRYEPKDEPQTDEPTWEQVKEYCNKRCLDIVDSAMRKQWYKDEPQTDCAWK